MKTTLNIDDDILAEAARLTGIKEKTALVSSVFNTDPNTAVDIEWRVATDGTIYRITDVKVSGLSLAKTQQDEFGSVIRANGNKVSALIDKLREMSNS